MKLINNGRARRSVKQIWDALEINHEGFKSLRKVMLGGFMTKFKKFKLEEGEPIKESQTRFQNNINIKVLSTVSFIYQSNTTPVNVDNIDHLIIFSNLYNLKQKLMKGKLNV